MDAEAIEHPASPSLSTTEGSMVALRACDVSASSNSFSDTLSYHSVISGSALEGRASFGSCTGKVLPSAGFMIPNLLTASWRSGTCSSGCRSSWTVCQRTKPWFVRAGIDGGAYWFFSGWREW